MNIVAVMGNLTRDIELRYTPKGVAVGNSALGVNRSWTGEDGQKREEVSFFSFTAFGRSAETMAQYLKKGDPVILEGRLKQESWDDRASGKKQYKIVIIVERFNFIPRRKADNGEQPAPAPAARQQSLPATEPADPAYAAPTDDSDIPF